MWKWTRCSNSSKGKNQDFYKALRNNFILIRRLKITIFLSRNFNGASLPPLQIHKWHMFKNRLKIKIIHPGQATQLKQHLKQREEWIYINIQRIFIHNYQHGNEYLTCSSKSKEGVAGAIHYENILLVWILGKMSN